MSIVENRRARFEYHLEEEYEAGMVLEGWEVKAIREAQRTKKLLLAKQEIRRLIGKTEQKGYTLVPLNLHYKGGRVKCQFALGKGKALHDKREAEKKRDWEREKGQLMRHKVSSAGKD